METSPIKKSKDLTENNFQFLFQNHFNDPNLIVKKAYEKKLEIGNHNMSTIKTMIIEFESPKDLIRILYIKTPIGNILGKILKKLMNY